MAEKDIGYMVRRVVTGNGNRKFRGRGISGTGTNSDSGDRDKFKIRGWGISRTGTKKCKKKLIKNDLKCIIMYRHSINYIELILKL